ncbi:MAG TPA: hypothetical protein ENJ09_00275, partial [Planctomycetes bacterium]|nr:hypothetical protein [Planctomycetota bacterium]
MRARPSSLLLATLVTFLAAGAARAQEAPVVSCSDPELARALDALARLDSTNLDPDWNPATLWPAWDERGEDGWGGERAWRRWMELLRAEAGGPDANTPRRRAELALAALLQGRAVDAWRDLFASGTGPFAAAVLPAFVPGRPIDALASRDPLPPGSTLTPFLPPPRGLTAADPAAAGDPLEGFGPFRGRSFVDNDVRIGTSRLRLELKLDDDGVQIDLSHLAGPAVAVGVRAPHPPGVSFGRVYADWEDVEEGCLSQVFDV